MKLLLALVLATLAGCATTTPPAPQFVSEGRPEVTLPPAPLYPHTALVKGDKYSFVLQAYVASFEACSGYVTELKTTVSPFVSLKE